MTAARQFRKKPVVIDAMQWDGTVDGATAIIDATLDSGGTARFVCPEPGGCTDETRHRIAIDTLEGTMFADPLDWVIRGIKGEFYPCKPDIFAATYDEVDQ